MVLCKSDTAHQNQLELGTCYFQGHFSPSKDLFEGCEPFPLFRVVYRYMRQGQTRALFKSFLIPTEKALL